MNAKRRAELQRRLTLNAVPRPPAGLAERIKADIPKYLEVDPNPTRFTRGLNFNLRIAASVMVLVTSVTVAMMVVREQREQKAASPAPRVVMFPPAARAVPTTDTTSTVQVAHTEELRVDIVEEAPVPQMASGRAAPPAMIAPPRQLMQEEADRAQPGEAERGVEGGYAGVLGGVVGGSAESQPPQTQVADDAERRDFAPEPAAAPAPPAIAQETAMANAPRRERAATAKTAAALAAPMAPPPASIPSPAEAKKDSVFGISVSSQAFDEIRTTLERGRRPAASSVDVEALVNYFAGAPAKRPRKVTLEVEASPAVVRAEGDHAVLRFTVDTPAGSGVAATNARIDVVMNDSVVARAQRVGDGEPLASEFMIPKGTSVTGLYELELKPGVRSSQLVATVRLHYKMGSVPKTLTEVVLGKDLAGSWQRASRRHRLASLGALWGESLKGTSGGGAVDVARRAEELATQEPDDVRARELARAANASAAGGR